MYLDIELTKPHHTHPKQGQVRLTKGKWTSRMSWKAIFASSQVMKKIHVKCLLCASLC